MIVPFDINATRQSLLNAILTASRRFGARHSIAADITPADITYRDLWTRAFILSDKIAPQLKDQSRVALMLPNTTGAVVTFMTLHMLGKTPCMINYTAGEANILHACAIADAKTVLTSKLFIEKANLHDIAKALEAKYTVIYLEDFRKKISALDKVRGLLKSFAPRCVLSSVLKAGNPDDAAVILYTSGSEGVPKGVALSHANILTNINQACARLDLSERDSVFNAMPLFHSFGLTVGMAMPLVCGLKTYLYPSPLHYKQIPKEVYKSRANIMLGTDTFYNGYARYAEPQDFEHVTLAVAGAEKLREKTRLDWKERFKVDIMQGYGVTETAPAVAINTPEQHKPGTVGQLFPGMDYRLEPVEGLSKGGRLFVKGPNIMLGYLKADKPGVIQPQGEWYDTGDIVDVDADKFITILGRAKRFAKIGGEMVSLTAVEELALNINAEVAHAALAIPDERKGEQIVLYTEDKNLTKDQILAAAREKGVAEISLPKQIIAIEAIPRLGNGKIDYPGLTRLVSNNS